MLSNPKAAERAIHCLFEGCSIRSTERLTGLNRNTIMRLLETVGERCEKLLDAKLQNLKCRYVQCDEIWSFVGKKPSLPLCIDSVHALRLGCTVCAVLTVLSHDLRASSPDCRPQHGMQPMRPTAIV